ncbi:hypothetical protein BGZ52_011411 [Haplosporangium bisporale]|nr:hypothetical protein BGZ52_011411 [Haplosporangium bisporale]KAF9208281.1 hypothetical protein BGZ59_010725 [Podila verticillata]KFH67882.1 CAMK/CAMK1 protein kinase [Podila verticillata NRRL 6337]
MIDEENRQRIKLPAYPGLERFQLIEKMGDGAFSNVYKAKDIKNDRIVAIKVVRKYDMSAQQNRHLHRDMKKKPRVTERANILKEVQIMRQLKHPGIIELYEFSESEEFYFLVIELAPGGELFHRIVKLTYFSEDLTRHVIVQVAHAIRYLHEEKGVIHRDIKPENILFEPIPVIPSPPGVRPTDDKEDEGVFMHGVGGGGIGRVKIADFGLSKVVWNEQTMTPCGTVGYTAPEIVKDQRYSKSVDMWAIGCVLYTLLCGFPPFFDESIQALTEKVARGQYTFLEPWWNDISDSVKDLITHLLCVDPNQRYTIDQFLEHPWIKAGQPPVANEVPEVNMTSPPVLVENKLLSNVYAMTPGYGAQTPQTPYKKRAENPLSPGIGLREVFDVSNAVHRMEEESNRRRARQQGGLQPNDALNTTTRQRQAFMEQLHEEDEEEETTHSDDGSGSGMSDDEISSGVHDVRIRANSENYRQAHEKSKQIMAQRQEEYQRAQEEMAAEKQQKYLRETQMAGHPVIIPASTISHSPSQRVTYANNSMASTATGRSNNTISSSTSASTMASTSSTSTTRRRRAGFELNIGQATLLNRRAKNHPPLHLDQLTTTPAMAV